MNFLIYKYGTIASSEKTTFDCFAEAFDNSSSDCTQLRNYLEEEVTPVLLNISDIDLDLPRILCRGKDRNWFLAGYPDVFEYYYVQPKLQAGDRDRMEQYAAIEKGHPVIALARMKNFYKNELKRSFSLSR